MEKQFIKQIKERSTVISIVLDYLGLIHAAHKNGIINGEEFETQKVIYSGAIRQSIGLPAIPFESKKVIEDV